MTCYRDGKRWVAARGIYSREEHSTVRCRYFFYEKETAKQVDTFLAANRDYIGMPADVVRKAAGV